MKRQFTCIAIDPSDQFAYVGTKTGDVLEVKKNMIILLLYNNINDNNFLD